MENNRENKGERFKFFVGLMLEQEHEFTFMRQSPMRNLSRAYGKPCPNKTKLVDEIIERMINGER